jgi:hypothetical protein
MNQYIATDILFVSIYFLSLAIGIRIRRGRDSGWREGWSAGWKAAGEDIQKQALAQGVNIVLVPPPDVESAPGETRTH